MSVREAAKALGEKGAPPSEEERLLFEAWMEGHCWALGSTWNGQTYISPLEGKDAQFRVIDPVAMQTRMLWAAWRDRAALVPMIAAASEPEAREGEG